MLRHGRCLRRHHQVALAQLGNVYFALDSQEYLMSPHPRCFGVLAASMTLALTACGESPPDAVPVAAPLEGTFVSIPKDLSESDIGEGRNTLESIGVSQQALIAADGSDFYIAVHRSALEGTWFLSTYLKQLHPGGPGPQTLGTRVVELRLQNDQLYVFDVDERRQTSDIFDPALIIEAYPVVEDPRFRLYPDWRDYVFIDPSAGLNRFGALADASSNGGEVAIETELMFAQRFRELDDGVAYELVFTGYADAPIGSPDDVEENDRRIAGTLGIGWRRYAEGERFRTVDEPPVPHYFLSEPRIVPNTGEIARYAAHWDLHPGMEPIAWHISPELEAIDRNSDANLVAAVKAGIESWNDAFGFTVFTATVAEPDLSFAQDDVNYFIVDPDNSLGFAYADWRTNPNTGEIRGASVYMSSVFFDQVFAADPEESGEGALRHPKPEIPVLTWNGEAALPSCLMWASDAHLHHDETSRLTAAEKLEGYIRHVTAHEVGHTLGLRHNFYGSLLPPSSSVMEYSLGENAIAQQGPGTYDIEAIEYLYGLSPYLPSEPFCTDEDTLVDPYCVRFDSGPDPLAYQVDDFAFFLGLFLDYGYSLEVIEPYFGAYVGGTIDFVRGGDPYASLTAWDALMARIGAPLDPTELAANPSLGVVADIFSRAIFAGVYMEPAGNVVFPPSDPAVIEAISAQASAVLLDADGVRSYETRRVVIDALAAAQNVESLQVLLDARDALELEIASGFLEPADRARTRDLIARIDSVTSPYFP